ncbi:hypothetical protein GGX14DRAFT_367474 [Mycena pura]|uniref:DUF6535 domain-containing protein n=1 Tax=Mycena pura TaxID=153505 RepID=A0AAD6VCU1_9AGAR|nr:hypothetical protein GGX14DRAFT_367474 [Mycena pura]
MAEASSPDPGSGSPYNRHYEPTAEIWKLYLKETEVEDKELAQLWQIGLDQLLIFGCKFSSRFSISQAGLFGAILTAFLIESRKDLRQDPLQEILQALRNDSATSTSELFRPTKSSLVVNAAWFSSLGLTLISAFAAVLVACQYVLTSALDCHGPRNCSSLRQCHQRETLPPWQQLTLK